MSDSGERTEQATDKRMKEVRSKGQLSRSQDITAWLGIGVAAMLLPATIAKGSDAATEQLFVVGRVIRDPDPATALSALGAGADSIMSTVGTLLAGVAIVVLIASVVQGGVHLKRMTGNYQQFDVVKGFGRTFGGQAWWNGAKSLLKTVVVGLVLWIVVQGLVPVFLSAGGLSVASLLTAAGGGTAALIQSAVAAGLVLAVADLAVVMRRNRKKTRMTKKEVKDENKSSDGDPQVKAQRRSRQMSMSRNRMMAAVADADVVLVNPTHYAVALRYEPGKSAPRVVAKGAGVIAARIREQAETDGVPLIRDIPLTRALHHACDLGQEIPTELYTAVARVLAFVMALRARGSASGVHSMTEPAI